MLSRRVEQLLKETKFNNCLNVLGAGRQGDSPAGRKVQPVNNVTTNPILGHMQFDR